MRNTLLAAAATALFASAAPALPVSTPQVAERIAVPDGGSLSPAPTASPPSTSPTAM